jgi:hypothetical protein
MPRKHLDDKCVLGAVDKRLNDVHDLWHQAEANYFEPDAFRIAIQGAIQTLRSVTFVLQNNKSKIPHFDDWYGKWRVRLSADYLLKWMVEARNKIEKQGDLDSHSYVRAELIASYLDEGPRVDVPVDLSWNVRAVLDKIPSGALGEHVNENGVIEIRRRWVVSDLPEHELLDAVAIAFGKIAELVQDAHRQLNISIPQSKAGVGKPPACMIRHYERRSTLISVKTGLPIEIREEVIRANPKEMEKAAKHYEIIDLNVKKFETTRDLAKAYFEIARKVFLKDGYHGAFLFLLKDKGVISIRGHRADSAGEKYTLMRSHANEAARIGADGVFIIDEAWIAKPEDLRPYERPSQSKFRKEVLSLMFLEKGGHPYSLSAEIVRDGERISLAKTQEDFNGSAFMFAPFLEAWGQTVPDSWMSASKESLEKSKKD